MAPDSASALPYERPEPAGLPGPPGREHKLATMTWLIAGDHSLQVEAFFCRQPDENHAAFYRFLLDRNARMYGVHFALDRAGDVYLTGRLPLAAISCGGDRPLLGCVLTYSDEMFNEAIKIGFGLSHQARMGLAGEAGESLANLRPFADLVTGQGGEKKTRREHTGRGQYPDAPAYDRGAYAAVRPLRAADRREQRRRGGPAAQGRRPGTAGTRHARLAARDLIRRRVWLAGIGMVMVAAVSQAAALAFGPIALVQPIFIIELPLTLLLARSPTTVARRCGCCPGTPSRDHGRPRRRARRRRAERRDRRRAEHELGDRPHRHRRLRRGADQHGLAPAASRGRRCSGSPRPAGTRSPRRLMKNAMSDLDEAAPWPVLHQLAHLRHRCFGVGALFLLQNALQAGSLVARSRCSPSGTR